MKTETLLHIRWRDSNMELGQTSRTDTYEVALMQTVGFLITESETQITIARDIVDETDCRGVITIPKENIVLKEKLYTGTVGV